MGIDERWGLMNGETMRRMLFMYPDRRKVVFSETLAIGGDKKPRQRLGLGLGVITNPVQKGPLDLYLIHHTYPPTHNKNKSAKAAANTGRKNDREAYLLTKHGFSYK